MAQIPVTVAQKESIGTIGPPIVTTSVADLRQYEWGILSCDLADTEEVDICALVGPTWKLATDVSGAAQKLTASIPSLKLEGGICYGILKDTTAAAVSVWLALGPGLKR